MLTRSTLILLFAPDLMICVTEAQSLLSVMHCLYYEDAHSKSTAKHCIRSQIQYVGTFPLQLSVRCEQASMKLPRKQSMISTGVQAWIHNCCEMVLVGTTQLENEKNPSEVKKVWKSGAGQNKKIEHCLHPEYPLYMFSRPIPAFHYRSVDGSLSVLRSNRKTLNTVVHALESAL